MTRGTRPILTGLTMEGEGVSDSQNGNLVKTAIINESGMCSLVLFQKLQQKPQPPPKNRNGQTATSYDKRQQRKSWIDCGPITSNNKTRQATARENSLSLFGKDEVGGSNPPSSSRKRPLFTRKAVFSFDICNNFWEFKFPLLSLTTQQATDREKTGLQGHFAFGGPFVQYVSIAWSTCYIFRLHPVFPGGDLRLHLPN